MLLPKIRPQDQIDGPKKHRKALSTSYNPPPPRPQVSRRTTSPEPSNTLCSPISFGAAGSFDDILRKYGFPTYRQFPTYNPPVFAPSNISGASTFVAPPSDIAPREYVLPTELQYQGGFTSTLLDYLMEPNPTPTLVRQINLHMGRRDGSHFWWDVRNVRAWDDFNMETIDSIPGLTRLMNIELPEVALPAPTIDRSKLQPETESALHDLYLSYYATKINAALKVAQGQTHMYMRSERGVFLSNYTNDAERKIFGGGRVVGVTKSFDRWNTGMRAEAPHRKVEYLQGLAHLHRLMREHSCRYGFIMTEIELVCVRAGTEDIPHFGFLEIATVQLKAGEGLTACIALWYLHMLAKEQPLPGQARYRIEVGGPAALSRQKCLEIDSWIPKPQLGEKREAKRLRGWVDAQKDPLHRRELPKRK
jgi:hypothetical protein